MQNRSLMGALLMASASLALFSTGSSIAEPGRPVAHEATQSAPSPRSKLGETPAEPRMSPFRLAQEDEEMGACVHSIGSASMCNYIQRTFCMQSFIHAEFYPGTTCEELAKQ